MPLKQKNSMYSDNAYAGPKEQYDWYPESDEESQASDYENMHETQEVAPGINLY